MQSIARVGDDTNHGRKILTGSVTMRIDGRSVARVGDRGSCPEHGTNRIIAGSDVLKDDDGRRIALHAHRTECGLLLIAHDNGTVGAAPFIEQDAL